MTIDELYRMLESPTSDLCAPFCYDESEEDCLEYICNKIDEYLSLAVQLDKESIDKLNQSFLEEFEGKLSKDKYPIRNFDMLRDVKAVAKVVKDVLKKSYQCYPDEAFDDLRKFLYADNNFYLYMLPQLRLYPCDSLYRLRLGTVDKSKDGELFHIPFEKRHLACSMRYSIPGYTALYLAGSFFTSWCEMDRPKLEGVNYAIFRFKEPCVFLDLGMPYNDLSIWELYSLFAMYPLLISCMVRVKHPQSPFKPEYIMPQLMMKIVREHSAYFKGIAYMSNKVPDSCDLHEINYRNFVVCVSNTLCKSGYDKCLASTMQMTDIKTITKIQADAMECYSNGVYNMDFDLLNIEEEIFHDIEVPMEIG